MKKNKILWFVISVVALWMTTSCLDDEDFSTSKHDLLSFSVDTIHLDTIFSNVPSSTQSMWVYNHTDKDIRCTTIRLVGGNQNGYRVNVDGTYLSQNVGYQTQGVEIRKGDSIRVFVELTSPRQNAEYPQLVADRLLFSLESGVQQALDLKAYAWDAILLQDVHIKKDTVFASDKPIVVKEKLMVDSAATLILPAGCSLYFDEKASLVVAGKLLAEGEKDNEVILRGSALNKLFDNLPYDRTAGRWRGVRFLPSSYGNKMSFIDIHSAYDGVVLDSCEMNQTKLLLENSTIHNCQGYGLAINHAKAIIRNSQLSNTLNHCLYVNGADVEMNQATIAQFYPFQGERASAVGVKAPLCKLLVQNSLITGYGDDELEFMGEEGANSLLTFDHCILRRSESRGSDSLIFKNVIYENLKDTTSFGYKHFKVFDTANYFYDFHLSPSSAAIDAADPRTALPYDRGGAKRDDKPDVGCYEYNKALQQ